VTRIVWFPQSLEDIEAIRAYIAEDSPRYADLTVRRIVAAVERLAGVPFCCPVFRKKSGASRGML
jgi:plasmid stabilization system protein ParE